MKTVKAGRLVYAVCYSQPAAADEPKERAAKSRMSSAARQRLNFRQAWQKLELEIAANFTAGDWFITATYDDAHLPGDRDGAIRYMGKFLKRLRQQRKRRGQELKYIYVTEEMPDEPGRPGRLHHHLIVNACPEDEETVPALWGAGQVDMQALLEDPRDGYEARARYLVKERHPGAVGRKVGLRAWTPSRNLQKPEVSSELVPENLTLTPPVGAFVLDRSEDVNAFGSYVYIKYLLPERRRRRRT